MADPPGLLPGARFVTEQDVPLVTEPAAARPVPVSSGGRDAKCRTGQLTWPARALRTRVMAEVLALDCLGAVVSAHREPSHRFSA